MYHVGLSAFVSSHARHTNTSQFAAGVTADCRRRRVKHDFLLFGNDERRQTRSIRRIK